MDEKTMYYLMMKVLVNENAKKRGWRLMPCSGCDGSTFHQWSYGGGDSHWLGWHCLICDKVEKEKCQISDE